MLKVLKLGGTSVGSGELIKSAAASITEIAKDADVAVVMSAMGGVSDLLENAVGQGFKDEKGIDNFVDSLRGKHLDACSVAVHEDKDEISGVLESLLTELKSALLGIHTSGNETDEKYRILAFGEKLSVPILAGAIAGFTPSSYYYGDDKLIITDGLLKSANPDLPATEIELKKRLLPDIENGIIPVLTGFMGCTVDGETTILGRGSSDYIASILGSALDADEIQIWTDVDGMLTADPNIVENSALIGRISYTEAGELAYFGAKVLHPKTLSPAVLKNIPIRIVNSKNPRSHGTLIVSSVESTKGKPTAITIKKEIILIDLHSTAMLDAHGYLAMIFNVFRDHAVSVDMISTTEVSVSITIDRFYEDDLEPVIEELGKIARVKVMKDKALICVIGEGMKSSPGLTGAIFSCLGNNGINVNCISQGSLEMNLSFVIDNQEADRAIQLLHEDLFSG